MGAILTSILILIMMVFWGLLGSWRRREEDLAAANRELRERSKAKDEFLSMVSHELRTPLTAMLGAVGLMNTLRDDPERSAQLLHIAKENGARLSALVDDLLDLRRIAGGSFQVKIEASNPASLIRSAIAELDTVFEEKQLTVEMDLGGADEIEVAADEARLLQVLYNLLYNATKFSPAKGCIRVEAEVLGERHRLRVSVLDEGPGLAPNDLEQVFEKFYQGERKSQASSTGTGLGLSIVKGIIDAHGGSVHAANRSTRGAVFSFEIPLWKSPASEPDGSRGQRRACLDAESCGILSG